jgi:opacity protein-like surface antigen
MLKRFVGAASLALLSTAVCAADWTYEGGDTPIAYSDNGAAQFEFACRGGDLTLGYFVRSPHRQVSGASSMNLSITPDGGSTSFAQDMPLIQSGGAWMVVRGPVARQWAAIAQKAKSSMAVAFVHKNAKGAFDHYDSNEFGAGGSSAAIRQVLARCG